MDKLIEELTKNQNIALRKIFGKHIKESFLIKIMNSVYEKEPYIFKYYDCSIKLENTLSGSNDIIPYDICRTIVGCHSSNTIFLLDEERRKLETDRAYIEKLVLNVLENIKLRNYGSSFFKSKPIMQIEPFITYNVPYDMFVLSVKIKELLQHAKHLPPHANLYDAISTKALAALSLLEDGFLADCYPICRTIIELLLKLVLAQKYPNLIEQFKLFSTFELNQSCCDQKYPSNFNDLYSNRKQIKQTKKIDFLHYGWVDDIPNYHNIVTNIPYTATGIFKFLEETVIPSEKDLFIFLKQHYKNCHGYAHGNVTSANYPLVHYFDIAIILYFAILNTYGSICDEFALDKNINGINIIEKSHKDFECLYKQYQQKNTENLKSHYNKKY